MKTTVIVLIAFFLSGCSGKKDDHVHTEQMHALAEKYTCPMHPQIITDKPGTCSICGMDLVKINTSQDLMLNNSEIKLANITTMIVGKRTYTPGIYATGKLQAGQEKSEVVTSRVNGRIEKLFVKETGKKIKTGQPLYTLYSESLTALQQEYLLAKEQYESVGKAVSRYKSFLDATEKKLLLLGLSKAQISHLTKDEVLKSKVTFLAPASGYVSEISVIEGQYVEEGTVLYRTENIGRLWVEAQVYPHEAVSMKPGDKLVVKFGTGKDEIDAKVTFISPGLNTGAQTVVVRAEIDNTKLDYKPGEEVEVYFVRSNSETIILPGDAVIRDGNGSHVYVKRRTGTFSPVKVITGNETADEIEITEGVNVGDTVVVTGAYLLYSELVLKKGFQIKDLN